MFWVLVRCDVCMKCVCGQWFAVWCYGAVAVCRAVWCCGTVSGGRWRWWEPASCLWWAWHSSHQGWYDTGVMLRCCRCVPGCVMLWYCVRWSVTLTRVCLVSVMSLAFISPRMSQRWTFVHCCVLSSADSLDHSPVNTTHLLSSLCYYYFREVGFISSISLCYFQLFSPVHQLCCTCIAFNGASLCLSLCLSCCTFVCLYLSVCLYVCLLAHRNWKYLCLMDFGAVLHETWCRLSLCCVYQDVWHCHYVCPCVGFTSMSLTVVMSVCVGFTSMCVTVIMSVCVCRVHEHVCHSHYVCLCV